MVEERDLNQLEGKNWMATMMSCWALGPFGAHRFYTGNTGSAWAMLIMTLTGCLAPISYIWALVDGFSIALGAFKAADGDDLYERIDWVGYLYMALMVLAILGVIAYFALIGVGLSSAMSGASTSTPVAP